MPENNNTDFSWDSVFNLLGTVGGQFANAWGNSLDNNPADTNPIFVNQGTPNNTVPNTAGQQIDDAGSFVTSETMIVLGAAAIVVLLIVTK